MKYLSLTKEQMRTSWGVDLVEKENLQYIGACDEQENLCGYLGFISGEQIDLVWIEVREENRRQGIAGKLMEQLMLTVAKDGNTKICAFNQDVKEAADFVKNFLWRMGFVYDGLQVFKIEGTEEYDFEKTGRYYHLNVEKVNWETAEKSPVLHTEEDRFTDSVFQMVGNDSMVCKDCIYSRDTLGAMECHKYSEKPNGVIFGGACEKHFRI